MLLRAVRWRAAASVATVLLAALTVLAAVLGPLWTRAGSESLLRDTLDTAGRERNAAVVSAHGLPGQALVDDARDGAAVAVLHHYGSPVLGLSALSDLRLAGGTTRYRSPLLWRQDLCAHVTVLTGRCPSNPGEVLLDRGVAARLPARVGTALDGYVTGEGSTDPDLPVPLVVVGTYLVPDPQADYWVGESASFVTQAAPDEATPDRVPATLTMPSTYERAAALYPRGERPSAFATSTRLLDVGALHLAEVPALTHELTIARDLVDRTLADGTVTTFTDPVTDQLTSAAAQGDALSRASQVVLAQLLLLAGVVLVLVVGASAAARAPEVAAARLRGLRWRTVLGLAVAEPLLLVAVGTPLGAALAGVVLRVMVSSRLPAGTPVHVPAEAVVALALAVAALVLVVVGVCGRELGRPVLELWQRTARSRRSGAVVAVLVVVAGVVGAVACVRAGAPYVLLTPVPVSLAFAVVTVGALPVVCAPVVRRTRAGRSVPRLLALRQLVRRREGGWLVGLLVVAFGLAATAVTTWSVTGRAAQVRSDLEVGSGQVLVLQADGSHPDVDLFAAVRRADPSGRVAMGVIEYLPFYGDPGGRVLAVDAPRLAAVARWDDRAVGLTPAQATEALHGKGKLPEAVVTDDVAVDPVAVQDTQTPRGGAVVRGLDGRRLLVHLGGTAHALPRALGSGTLLDGAALPHLLRTQLAGLEEVWLAHPDAAVVRSLAASGLHVVSTDDAESHRSLLQRQGPALAVLLSLVAAGLALATAVATTLFSALTAARRRGFELAALAAVGVPARMLRSTGRSEALLLLLTGLAAGIGAGATACAVTLRSLPLFSDDLPLVVPLTPRPTPVAVLVVTALALTVVTSLLVSRVLLRAADPSRLREVQA